MCVFVCVVYMQTTTVKKIKSRAHHSTWSGTIKNYVYKSFFLCAFTLWGLDEGMAHSTQSLLMYALSSHNSKAIKATVEINNTDWTRYRAIFCWETLVFMWMPIDTSHLPKHPCRSSTPDGICPPNWQWSTSRCAAKPLKALRNSKRSVIKTSGCPPGP